MVRMVYSSVDRIDCNAHWVSDPADRSQSSLVEFWKIFDVLVLLDRWNWLWARVHALIFLKVAKILQNPWDKTFSRLGVWINVAVLRAPKFRELTVFEEFLLKQLWVSLVEVCYIKHLSLDYFQVTTNCLLRDRIRTFATELPCQLSLTGSEDVHFCKLTPIEQRFIKGAFWTSAIVAIARVSPLAHCSSGYAALNSLFSLRHESSPEYGFLRAIDRCIRL